MPVINTSHYVPAVESLPIRLRTWYDFEDCMSANYSVFNGVAEENIIISSYFGYSNFETGNAFIRSETSHPVEGRPGIWQMGCDGGANIACIIGEPESSTNNCFFLTNGTCTVEAEISLTELSSVESPFEVIYGLSSEFLNDNPYRIYFTYKNDGTAGASPNWKTISQNGEEMTSIDTNIPAYIGWVRLKIFSYLGEFVKFYINDDLVATVTNNIPITYAIGPGLSFVKTSGVASYILIDWMRCEFELNNDDSRILPPTPPLP